MTFALGETIGPYRIVDQIGQGGMATVFKAYHTALDRYVAIKVLNPAIQDDPNFLSRFQREARIVAKLDHPNIVSIYDFAIHDGTPYLVMQYIEGKPLKAILRGVPLSLSQVLMLIRPVVAALDYAHARGVLHRDIKPSNIIIGQDGQIYLADFGLARMMQATDSTQSQDSLIGTPQYLAPEQAKSEPTDTRTDVYALGIVLFEMLTGKVPFTGDTPYTIIHDQIYTAPPAPSSINPSISSELDAVLLTALAKDPNARFASVLDLYGALEKASGISSPGEFPSTHRPRGFNFADPKTLAIIGGGLAIVLILIFGGLFNTPAPVVVPSTATVQAIAVATAPATEAPTAIPSPTVVPTSVPTLAPTNTPTATPVPPTPTITPTPTIAPPPGMIYIPAGTFWMGAVAEDSQANANEKPGHSVEVSAYFIDQYEVSNEDYRRCVTAGACEIPRGVFSPQSPNLGYGNPASDNLPVVLIPHRMATLYCEWAGKRLPREAEWEKAARGATDTRIYPWGNPWEGERANSAGGNLGPVPVFAYNPKGCSPFGVCNMTGNVAEWIADAYSPNFYADSIRALVPPAIIRDPFNTDFNSGNFVVRGGSFKSNPFDSRVSKRNFRPAGEAVDDLGFRCIKPFVGR